MDGHNKPGEGINTTAKSDWDMLVEQAEAISQGHAQRKGIGIETFGEKVMNASKMRDFGHQVSMVDSIVKRFRDFDGGGALVLEKNEYILQKQKLDRIFAVDHKAIEKTRHELMNLPPGAYHKQNQIFTGLANEYSEDSNFILQTLNPSEMQKAGADDPMQRFLFSLEGYSKQEMEWYDFIGELTELDEAGNPVVPDATFKNFFEWYQYGLAKLQEELNDEISENLGMFSDGLKNATEAGRLPQNSTENLTFLDPSSSYSRNLEFYIFDMADKRNFMGACGVDYYEKGASIGIRADLLLESYSDKYSVLYHELTHAISGDTILFDDNKEARRIVNEALTEHISNVIRKSVDDYDDYDEDEFKFMSGETYKTERAVVDFLANGGTIKISPTLFYEAYMEWDREYNERLEEYNYREWADDDFDEPEPKPTVGPKKQALHDALLKAFPNYANLSELGEMIVDKFNSLKDSE